MDVTGVHDEWAQTASLRGEYVDPGHVEMIGGLAAPTRWPLAIQNTRTVLVILSSFHACRKSPDPPWATG